MGRDIIATYGTIKDCHDMAANRQEDNSKMRKLYTSTYRDMSEYLQDFGFGGLVGYGKRVPGCLVEEELMGMKKMYQ